MRLIDADKMATNELVAFMFAQAMTTDAATRWRLEQQDRGMQE